MSLPRKDVRFYLEHEIHTGLLAVCDALEVDINDQVERVVTEWVLRRVSEARVIAEATERIGIDRRVAEPARTKRKARE